MTVSNIAADVQVPNSIQTLGNLVSTAQGIQAYQTGKIAQQQAAQNLQTGALQQQRIGYEQQAEQQANQERQAVVTAMQQKDPALLPGPDGIIDGAKSLARLQQLAPQTWATYADKINANNANATSVNKQILGLSQEKIQDLGKFFGSQTGQPVSKIIANAQEFKEANPSLGPQIDLALKAYEGAGPATQDAIDARTMHIATRAETLAQQKELATPSYGTVPRGAVTDIYQTNKFAPGGQTTPMAPTATVGTGIAPTYITDPGGNLHSLPGTAGAPATAFGASNAPAITRQQSATPGGWVNSAGAQTNLANASGVTEARNSALGAPAIRNTVGNLLDLVENSDAKIGPGADKLQAITGPLNTISGGKFNKGANAYAEIDAYANRLALQTAQQLGQTSVAGTLMAQAATGHPAAQTREAAREKLRYIDGLTTLSQAYGQGLSQAAGTGPNQNPNAKVAYDQKFTSAYGTDGADVFRIKADYDRGDPASIKDAEGIIKKSGKPRSYWVTRADQMNDATNGFLYGK